MVQKRFALDLKLPMSNRLPRLVCSGAALLALLAPQSAIAAERIAPGKSRGGPFAWSSAAGLEFVYTVPKRYDPRAGANLTFILHGSNLTRDWGFANHRPGVFRPDDVVVCPDGTTPNGNGGFNFLGQPADLESLHALHEELRAAFKVRATFLYGHSQGSFFAFHYAGAYPADVQGVVGHASGVWTWTAQPAAAHHQAIVLMHGTQDPVVPYGQSAGGLGSFREARYPLVRLRSLEEWNHWPAEHNGPTPHTSQQLAWCEGMTTADPDRLAASLATFLAVKEREWHDYAGTYTVAKRIAGLESVPAALRRRAERVEKAVDALGHAHAQAILRAAGKDPGQSFAPDPWVGHAVVYLRAFAGVPAADELAVAWASTLDGHRKKASEHLRLHYQAGRAGEVPAAFREGVRAVASGFLDVSCQDREMLSSLEKWRKAGEEHGLDDADVREFDRVVPPYRDALAKGRQAFEALNRKLGKL